MASVTGLSKIGLPHLSENMDAEDARAIRNAVFRAVEYAQSGIIADVEAHIDVMKVEKNG